MSPSRQDESDGAGAVLQKRRVEASYCLPSIAEFECEKTEHTTATSSSVSDMDDSPQSQGLTKSVDAPKAGDCHDHTASRSVGRRLRTLTTSAGHNWKQKYKRLLADYNDQGEDLEEVKDELSAAEYLLSKEKTKRLQMDATQAILKEDLQGTLDDCEKLYEQCAKMKRLLESRDQDIASLVGQVNLLIQVGSMTRSDGDSITDVSSDPSRDDFNRSSSLPDKGSVISTLGSFFVASRQPSSMEWKK